jgi:hypothetical protein
VLLDRRHRPWAIATAFIGLAAVGAYIWLDWRTPGGLTGGSTVGLWYGIAGSALMVYAGLLAVHRYIPRWWRWIGSRQTWLRGHIWLGSLSVVLIVCHAHGRFGGLLEQALWVVLGTVILTGIYGLLLQQFLPRFLAQRIPDEAPYGQIPHLCRVFRTRADELVDEMAPAATAKAADGPTFATELRAFHEAHIRPFLTTPVPRGEVLLSDLQSDSLFDALRRRLGLRDSDVADVATQKFDELEEICRERRRLAEQERLHGWLHAWLLLHIPLSAALLVLGVAHAVAALYY